MGLAYDFNKTWREFIRQEIARWASQVGFSGHGLSGDTIISPIDPALVEVDNFRGVPLTEELPDLDELVYVYNAGSGKWELRTVNAAPSGGHYVNEPLLIYESDEPVTTYTGEPVYVRNYVIFATDEQIAAHIADTNNPHATTAVQVGAEPYLGLPAEDGQVLVSTVAGVRSWATVSGVGGGDMDGGTF